MNADSKQASNPLGQVTLANGRRVNAHVVHAVALIITDGNEIVLLMSKQDSGAVKPELPVGLVDSPLHRDGKKLLSGAAREVFRLAGIESTASGRTNGARIMNRPDDVRVAPDDFPRLGIQKDDIFMVSLQALRYDIPNLALTTIVPENEATTDSVFRMPLETVKRDTLGVADHFFLIARFPTSISASAAHLKRNRVSQESCYRQKRKGRFPDGNGGDYRCGSRS